MHEPAIRLVRERGMAMDEAARSAWCREQGLYPAELEAWKRDAIAGPVHVNVVAALTS